MSDDTRCHDLPAAVVVEPGRLKFLSLAGSAHGGEEDGGSDVKTPHRARNAPGHLVWLGLSTQAWGATGPMNSADRSAKSRAAPS